MNNLPNMTTQEWNELVMETKNIIALQVETIRACIDRNLQKDAYDTAKSLASIGLTILNERE